MSTYMDIRKGVYDEELEEIQEALVARKKTLAARRFDKLEVGARVRFVQTTRPTYLRGVEGTISGKKINRLMVRLDHPTGRFRGEIRTHPALLEEVTTGK